MQTDDYLLHPITRHLQRETEAMSDSVYRHDRSDPITRLLLGLERMPPLHDDWFDWDDEDEDEDEDE